MSEDVSAKGVTGGVLGALAAIVGFTWTATLLMFLVDLLNYSSAMSFVWIQILSTYKEYAGIVAFLFFPTLTSLNLFLTSSVVLGMLVFIFGTTLGLGFRNLYSKSAGYKGLVYLVAISVGMLVAGMLIAMGAWFQTITMQFSQYVSLVGAIFIPLRFPATSYTLMGEIVLGVVLILLGVASIGIRNLVGRRNSALAAGVLSIIGGADFVLHFIINIFSTGQVGIAPSYGFSMMPMLISGFVLFTIFTLVGFVLLLVASVLWTRVFLSVNES